MTTIVSQAQTQQVVLLVPIDKGKNILSGIQYDGVVFGIELLLFQWLEHHAMVHKIKLNKSS